MIVDENFLVWAWRELHGKRPHIVLRLTASLVSGLVLLAASLVGAWTWAHVAGVGRVREEEFGSAVTLGAAIWLGALVRIWRNTRIALHVIWTGAIIAAVIGLGFTVDEVLLVRESEFFIAAFMLLGLGGVVLVWLPLLMRSMRHRPVTDAENVVRVNCPECGYSLVGLRDLRCPECGTQFTLDELIRAQNYGGAELDAESAATPGVAQPIGAVAKPGHGGRSPRKMAHTKQDQLRAHWALAYRRLMTRCGISAGKPDMTRARARRGTRCVPSAAWDRI